MCVCVSGGGTYSQEQHAVHGERGVARVEGQPATEIQKEHSTLWYVLDPLAIKQTRQKHYFTRL